MRAAWVLTLLFALPLAACGGSSSGTGAPAPGTIAFGMTEANHQVQSPTDSFGPDDRLAYVARLKTVARIAPHAMIREFFVRVRTNGKEEPIMNDSFSLPIAVHDYVTFKGISVAKLYRVGFVAPGTYRVRLRQGSVLLAEGTFHLK